MVSNKFIVTGIAIKIYKILGPKIAVFTIKPHNKKNIFRIKTMLILVLIKILEYNGCNTKFSNFPPDVMLRILHLPEDILYNILRLFFNVRFREPAIKRNYVAIQYCS